MIYHAAEASADDRLLVTLKDHIRACPECRACYESHMADITSLKDALHATAAQIIVPSDFSSRLTAAIALERRTPSFIDRIVCHIAQSCHDLLGNRRVVASAACAASVIAIILFGVLLGRIMDTSPTAAPRVTSGRLMTFTLQPTPDGRVIGGLKTRTYCQITRDRQESLR